MLSSSSKNTQSTKRDPGKHIMFVLRLRHFKAFPPIKTTAGRWKVWGSLRQKSVLFLRAKLRVRTWLKCYLLTSSARRCGVPAVTWWSCSLDDKVLPDCSLDGFLKAFDAEHLRGLILSQKLTRAERVPYVANLREHANANRWTDLAYIHSCVLEMRGKCCHNQQRNSSGKHSLSIVWQQTATVCLRFPRNRFPLIALIRRAKSPRLGPLWGLIREQGY